MRTSTHWALVFARIHRKAAIGICGAALAAAPFVGHSQSIGVNFAGRQWSIGGNTPETLDASDTAGAYAQINWNNVDPTAADSGGLAQIVGPTAGVLVDNTGAATALTFSYSGQGMWSVNQTTHTGNEQLLNGYSDVENNDANIGTYNFGNIGFGLYDVYVYVTADSNDRTAGVSLNGGSQTFLLTDGNGYDFSNPLIQATATAQGDAQSGHYVMFEGVSGSSFEVDLHRYGNNVGVGGIQIVAVPEPSTVALFTMAGIALLGIVRRRS